VSPKTVYGLVNEFIDPLYTPIGTIILRDVSLMCTVYISAQHHISLLQPALSSSDVPWQWLQIVEKFLVLRCLVLSSVPPEQKYCLR
jgi:hypothetical protein